jgi:ADP-dependent NAD(P)H-hydrate dehydratase / NAD(P)H-hydrate epimerase
VPAEEGLIALDERTAASLLPARDPRSHKGTHGTLLCLCGSVDYAGAALLTTAAATRAAAGLVALAVPASLQALFAGRVLEAVTLGLPERSTGELEPDAAFEVVAGRHADAIACGSGWPDSRGHLALLLRLVRQPAHDPDAASRERLPPMVIDGTALNMLARSDEWWRGVRRPCVLTPHPGEFARLTAGNVRDEDDDRRAAAAAAARRFGQVVVLKGARTVVAAPDGRLAMAPFENPGMATAGTGDVLAGIIGALLAQGVAPFEAACLGVHMHGAAGERVRERLGEAGSVASDLLPEIPQVRRRLAQLRDRPEPRVGFASRSGSA